MKVDINKTYTVKLWERSHRHHIVYDLKFVRMHHIIHLNISIELYTGWFHNIDKEPIHCNWCGDGRNITMLPDMYDLVEISRPPDNVIKCKMPTTWLQKQVRDEESKNANT